ncbi:hypothetical protein CEXT_292561 [Caerostris extrusa]|uniref:Maturase K n=1 Tax=Caerostris extrusa TaxID=172846 RepID=A0AAV4W7B4_CAEEX|nr:hypothetical protein CEXT_292561 [Caerostris extrusa]
MILSWKHEESSRRGSSRFLESFRNDYKEIPNQVLSFQRDKGINASFPLQIPKNILRYYTYFVTEKLLLFLVGKKISRRQISEKYSNYVFDTYDLTQNKFYTWVNG